MYNNNRGNNNSGGHHGGNRRGRSGGFRRGGSRGRKRFAGQHIDINKFINKVSHVEAPIEYVPTHKFSDFNIEEVLKQNILARGYVHPTPIQDKTIPHILEGRDVIGLANTGTGKTAAFLIPLINKVINNAHENIVIMVPTRELALQINQEFRAFIGNLKIFSVLCIGGANIHNQISQLRRKNNFIIGTPGRLKDLVQRGVLKLGNTQNIVLDEVDRMLDMGFLEDIKFLISQLPEQKQSLFFSATLPKQTEPLMQTLLKNPITLSVVSGDTSKNVDQDIVKVQGKDDKIQKLQELLLKDEFKRVLIFGKTKYGVEDLSGLLNQKGFKATSIHGNKSQNQRERALRSFKTSGVNILVATDVAARGLDISDITHVINYDIPQSYEDYVHRIGRTGRANKKGFALTFVE